MSNPLLESHVLPPFSKIQAEHIEPAVDKLIAESLMYIEQLLDAGACTWETLIEPLEVLDDRLSQAWSPVSHLNAVRNTPELRDAYNRCIPKLADYGSKVGQNKRLYEAYQTIHESPAFKIMNVAQKKVITNAIRDFKLAGVALPEEKRQKFSQLKQELSSLQSQFSDHVLDATDHWFLLVGERKQCLGIPAHALESAQAAAKAHEQIGYRFGLDYPSYHAVMTYAEDRTLREKMYEAYSTRASDQGPDAGRFDNSEVMLNIVSHRHELSRLLDFNNYAELSLATKMANSTDEVLTFLNNLAAKAKAFAKKEYESLKAFAKECGQDDFKPWDIGFYSEKLRKKSFDISQEELRPYFPAPKVIDGLFSVVNRLYGIGIKAKTDVDVWHKDVTFYEVTDETGVLRGQFYFDLYARAQKRSGAWMDECRVRLKKGKDIQVPVAYLTCNFSAPVGDRPSLLTHDEVCTLFHEFGHGLHHLLTQVDYAPVSGINGVPWDAVELPSQFMENWCWEKEALHLFAGHFETGAPLPDAMLERLKKAKNFQSGLGLLRQTELGLFDFRLHAEFQADKPNQIQSILNDVRALNGVYPVPDYNRFQHGFSHIFAGGYAAGYYSYLWAEVLSADAFSRFEEEGIFNQNTGRSFLSEILEKGGGEEPAELFEAFRGRKPSLEALLLHHGLSSAA